MVVNKKRSRLLMSRSEKKAIHHFYTKSLAQVVEMVILSAISATIVLKRFIIQDKEVDPYRKQVKMGKTIKFVIMNNILNYSKKIGTKYVRQSISNKV